MKPKYTAIGGLAGLLITPAYSATVSIGINFSGDAGTPGNTVAAPVVAGPNVSGGTAQAGVVPQLNWNNYGGNSGTISTGIVNDSGASTNLAVSFAAQGTWGYESTGTPGPDPDGYDRGSGHTQLASKYLDAGSDLSSATFTMTNLASVFDLAQPYTVYIYNRRNEGPGTDALNTSAYDVNGTIITGYSGNVNPWGGTDAGNWVNGRDADVSAPGNYFAITGLTSSTLTIRTDGSDYDIGTGFRSPINGIQIVGTAIPEAGTMSFIMGVGLVGLLRRKR